MSMSIDQITDVMSNKAMDLSRSLQNVISRHDISDPNVMSQVQNFTNQLYSTIGLQSAILDVYKKINQVIIQRI